MRGHCTSHLRCKPAALLVLLLVLFAVAAAGCSLSGIHSSRNRSSVKDGLPAQFDMAIPDTDDELPPHEPRQVVVRVKDSSSIPEVLERVRGQLIRSIPRLNVIVLELPPGASVTGGLRTLSEMDGVEYAHANVLLEVLELPTAPAFHDGRQWGPQKIGAPAAWSITTGDENVAIAVVDTGVDADHPSLAGKVIWGVNTTENGNNADDWLDRHGHGTHVAGIAAAWPDRGEMAGIAWKSPVLAVKVLGDDGTGSIAGVADGIVRVVEWAEQNSRYRVVINMSLGGGTYARVLQDAIDEALKEDIVVVAAMGNDSARRIVVPAAMPGVIAVGASDANDQVASFSTRGSHISVVAPGVDIYSSHPARGYRFHSGTSMATPHVAGAAALLLAVEPGLTPREVRSRLEATADHPRGPGSFDEAYGYGRINVSAALLASPSLQRYGTVAVRLLDRFGSPFIPDRPTGQGIYRVEFALLDADNIPVASQRADADGEAVFHMVPYGTGYKVRANVWLEQAGRPEDQPAPTLMPIESVTSGLYDITPGDAHVAVELRLSTV